jgi:hypothetical protein
MERMSLWKCMVGVWSGCREWLSRCSLSRVDRQAGCERRWWSETKQDHSLYVGSGNKGYKRRQKNCEVRAGSAKG